MATPKPDKPADQDQRDLILNDLDTTMLVEAAAGTGKTTSMVGRMVNLLAHGKCSPDTLAAVTFTRKAAAELRTRFQVGLEKAFRQARQPARKRLAYALAAMDRCFIGTIHSFCGRLLRERPVEAGVDVAFREIDEVEDTLLRQQAWSRYVASLYADGHPILAELEDLGLEIGSLEDAFTRFADYPDVEEWPAAVVDLPDLNPALQALQELVLHMEEVVRSLPEQPGNDKLMPKFRLIVLMWRQLQPDHVPDLMDILAEFKSVGIVQRNWPGGKQQACEELERWDAFRTTFAEPLVRMWREKRYEPAMRALKPARDLYDRLRQERAVLNYQDLLIGAAALLRDKPRIRAYFRERFTHVLVDEFQDTDPIQAEVMMLLTADNPDESHWRACRPVPGSLFVVGDPKQSIYRFRRADIVTYNQVRAIILESKGKVVTLAVNFRTTKPLVDWVNQEFEQRFPEQSSDYSPQYVSLKPAPGDGNPAAADALKRLAIPAVYTKNEEANEYDSDLVAQTIRNALSSEPAGEGDVHPGLFMIVTPGRDKMALYGRKLEQLGIPHQVTGGKALRHLPELALLCVGLNAVVHPDDPVALVAALRSELFGLSDVDLFRFKREGGVFSYFSETPKGLDPETAARFGDAFQRLRQYSLWFARMPIMPALENVVADLGLLVRAAAGAGGNVQAGSLAKALELLRADEAAMWSPVHAVERLVELTKRTEGFDGMPCSEDESSRVRIMNLHKVKGLEAPVVFLADPTGFKQHAVDLHVDRSGERVRGYMRIVDRVAGRTRETLLALPPQWASYEEVEKSFQEAERIRLMYVAATRAGQRLIITQREKGQHYNPWKFFDKTISDTPVLPVPPRQEPLFREEVELAYSDVDRISGEAPNRWAAATALTYRTAAAKALALSAEGTAFRSAGEYGTEWGTVIHALLQAAMLDRDADLIGLAKDALADQDLDTGLAQDAVEVVHSVMDSDIWRRAVGAEHVLVEVPFETLMPETGSSDEPARLLVRGTIDLAFREPAGWILVDYKTDRVPAAAAEQLITRYNPQVQLYCQAWHAITGEPVHEAGLYFTHTRMYRTVT